MDKIVEMAKSEPFTNEDIMKICNNKVTILKYQDLTSIRPGDGAIDRVIGPHKAAIILYETAEDWGHWISFFAVPNSPGEYEFFDSYGLTMDAELKFMDSYYRKISSTEKVPHLTYLVSTDSKISRIYWNQVDLQSTRKDTNTCGRWASLRVMLREIPLDTFQNMFIKQHFKPDWYATALTLFQK